MRFFFSRSGALTAEAATTPPLLEPTHTSLPFPRYYCCRPARAPPHAVCAAVRRGTEGVRQGAVGLPGRGQRLPVHHHLLHQPGVPGKHYQRRFGCVWLLCAAEDSFVALGLGIMEAASANVTWFLRSRPLRLFAGGWAFVSFVLVSGMIYVLGGASFNYYRNKEL